MSTVRDVADYMLQRADEDSMRVTHLKLQKLCYYAQGYSLALLSRPMFEEPIEAWEHGPVVRELYDTYKRFGKNSDSGAHHTAGDRALAGKDS